MTVQQATYGEVRQDRPRLDEVEARYHAVINDLFDTWNSVRGRNRTIKRYYEMKNEMKSLGISIPPQCEGVNSVVGWCAKAIAAHSNRSKLDGFVSASGAKTPELDALVRDNRLRSLYQQAVRSSLVYGLATITVMHGGEGQPAAKVRVFSANQSCVIWDKDKDRIRAGVVLANVDRNGTPCKYIVHTADAVITLYREGNANTAQPRGMADYTWHATTEPHRMGRPMMEVLVHDPDPDRPLGHSMITPELMGIVDKAMRDVLRMEVGAEFFTAPQRYILGASEDLFSETAEDGETGIVSPAAKWNAYLGALMSITRDENGDIPQVGQFAAGDANNFTAVFENDAQRFSGATNVPLAQLGVLSNTYTSSDALNATDNPLIMEVEVMNDRNRETMEEVARMMLAVSKGVALDELADEDKAVQAAFRNPAMTTLSATADAWTKLTAYASWLPETDVFWEQVGIDKPTRTRMGAEREAANVTQAMNAIADSLTQQALAAPDDSE